LGLFSLIFCLSLNYIHIYIIDKRACTYCIVNYIY
jgi:hypothetical protein